jgi:hypothetical protein
LEKNEVTVINNQPVPPDPWTVQAPRQSAPVPVGMYLAKFQGVTDHQLPTGEPRWRWVWEIVSGEHAGKQASALTNQGINPNTHSGVLIAGLIGQQLKPGDSVKALVDACTGKTYLVSVQAGPKGGKPGVRSVGSPPAM